MTTKEFQSITPYIQPLQKQGSFYTFSSAAEDYTTTMSEISDVKFRFSKYALLKIPDLIENYNIVSNSTKLNAIPGVFINQFDGYTKNELFSEVFENYCLNFENGLLSQDTYDNRELKTVAERVFFKFIGRDDKAHCGVGREHDGVESLPPEHAEHAQARRLRFARDRLRLKKVYVLIGEDLTASAVKPA